jgi:transposase
MTKYAGLDVSLEETAICIVDETGAIVREASVATEVEAIDAWLRALGMELGRVGLEAGPLSGWLHAGLRAAGWPAICIETRRLRAVTRTMPVKNDRKDAAAIAQAMRTGWFRAVHVKSPQSQRLRVLLRYRRQLQAKRLDLENELRGTLKAFGLKLGRVSPRGFAARIAELVAGDPFLAGLVAPMLTVRAQLIAGFNALHAQLLAIVKEDAVCRRLMTVPGVGAVTALAFKTGVDDPHRFAHSADVGPHFGLTPRRYQSGQTDRSGRISKCGDTLVRSLLFEAAMALIYRVRAASDLKHWARALAKRVGARKAATALARRLAVVLHRLWLDGSTFQPHHRHDVA